MSPGLRDASIDSSVDSANNSHSVLAIAAPSANLAARLLHVALLLAAAALFALHFAHLTADFPNHSPWMDWSKYTDEGWYGDAAIRQIQLGHWYVPGDFNPAAALPVWPAIEYLLFKLTGVSLTAARALSVGVFGGILLAGYLLVRRCSLLWDHNAGPAAALPPAISVALLAASPFCYAFTRLAILEPLLILLTLLALLAAAETKRRSPLPIVSLGILIPLMILTKTTAVFLLPAVVWMLWAASAYRPAAFLRAAAPAAAIAAALWSAYFFLLVRPRFLEDYRYLFSANGYTGITRDNAWTVIEDTLRDGIWMGKLLYPLALVAASLALLFFRRCLRNPLVPSLMLWAGGYAAFLAYHDNLQPRYYLVIAVPLTLLAPVVFEQLARQLPSQIPIPARGLLLAAAAASFAAVALTDAAQTLGYVRTPEYTFIEAAKNLKGFVAHDTTGRSELVLSISGSDLSLMTGLPSICDDFGTLPLEDRVALYRPGWYATWNQVDDDKMDALSPLFHLQRVAAFPAFDDPERNLLILYRLDPPLAPPPLKQKRKSVPKQLQTRIGQQPSASQLEH